MGGFVTHIPKLNTKHERDRQNNQVDLGEFLPSPFAPGDAVVDRESDDVIPSVGTVLAVVEEPRADEFVIDDLPSAPTVAEFNPGYPARDEVVTISFGGETEYNYPASRLRQPTPAEVTRV